jgi:hypothetical protein
MMASAFTLLLAISLASAPAETATAQKLFDAGSLAYARGRYDDAARAFEAAYELLPAPAIAFSLAQAHRRQYFVAHDPDDLTRAIELYHRYLDEMPAGNRRDDAVEQLQQLESITRPQDAEPVDGPDEATDEAATTELVIYADVADASAAIDDGPFAAVPTIVATTPGVHRVRMRAPGYLASTTHAVAVSGRLMPVAVRLDEEPARLELRTRAGATVRVDGRELGRTPLSSRIELAAGKHVVALQARGRVSSSRTLSLERGQLLVHSVELPRTRQRTAALVLLGTGGGLWVAGGTTLGLTFAFQQRAQRIADLRGERNLSDDELQRLEDSLAARDRLRGATIGLLSAAAITTVVGVVLLFTDRG